MDVLPLQTQSEQRPKPRKLRRISRACDFCHKRSIRCTPNQEEPNRCKNCIDFGSSCTYRRPFKKRGVKGPKTGVAQPTSVEQESKTPEQGGRLDTALTIHPMTNHLSSIISRSDAGLDTTFTFPLSPQYRNLALSNTNQIVDLVSVYFAVVYPM